MMIDGKLSLTSESSFLSAEDCVIFAGEALGQKSFSGNPETSDVSDFAPVRCFGGISNSEPSDYWKWENIKISVRSVFDWAQKGCNKPEDWEIVAYCWPDLPWFVFRLSHYPIVDQVHSLVDACSFDVDFRTFRTASKKKRWNI